MKIVKLEDFHADGGWDTYSFLKITTDEGITGWSEFNESRRKGMTSLIHGLGATLIGACAEEDEPPPPAVEPAPSLARSPGDAGAPPLVPDSFDASIDHHAHDAHTPHDSPGAEAFPVEGPLPPPDLPA